MSTSLLEKNLHVDSSSRGTNNELLPSSFGNSKNFTSGSQFSQPLLPGPSSLQIIVGESGSILKELSTSCSEPDGMKDGVTSTWSARNFLKKLKLLFWTKGHKGTEVDRSLNPGVCQQKRRTKCVIALTLGLVFAVTCCSATLVRQHTSKNEMDPIPEMTSSPKKPEKHCRQIGTKEECRQNQNCRWLMKKFSCEPIYMATFQFKEDIVEEGKQSLPEVNSGEYIRPKDETRLNTLYLEYLVKHNKPTSRLDDAIHRETFRQNWNKVLEHNAEFKLGRRTWSKGVNSFTDMTDDEISVYAGKIEETGGKLDSFATAAPSRTPSLSDMPQTLDFRENGVVTPVKDQRSCACSISFAAVACMESKYALLNNETIDLSEQQVTDCSKSYGNTGCSRGSFNSTLEFMRNVGVDTEANIPYAAVGDRECRDSKRKYANRITEWKRIEPNEDKMKEAIYKHGPILTSFSVDREFLSYAGGAFNADSYALPNHAALIVGYGHEGGHPVWFIKNSWGESWGQRGFMSIARNASGYRYSNGAYAIISVYQH